MNTWPRLGLGLAPTSAPLTLKHALGETGGEPKPFKQYELIQWVRQ